MTLKIGDFGISKLVEESTRTNTFKGQQHIRYMAPEGWANEVNTAKIDVYAAGIVFYQILTLEHPLLASISDNSDYEEWRKAHLFGTCQDIRAVRAETPLFLLQLLPRMVNKRPSDRPSWDEALDILNTAGSTDAADSQNPSINEAIDLIQKKRQEAERHNLQIEQREESRKQTLDLYRFSWERLMDSLKPTIENFNAHCQHGKISSQIDGGTTTFGIPTGPRLEVTVFEPRIPPLRLRIGELLGGGWIGNVGGRSANLLLLSQAEDDLYGQWVVYEISRSGILAASLESLGLKGYGTRTFGLRDAHFYDHIIYAHGAAHIFNYTACGAVVPYFEKLLPDSLRDGS